MIIPDYSAVKKINFEEELSKPLEDFLIKKGFLIRCEIKNCDMVAQRDEKYYCIELKKTLSVDLLCQAVERKKMVDGVFICIPAPKYGIGSRNFKNKLKLLKELNIGLIIIYMLSKDRIVEIVSTPKIKENNKKGKKRELLIKEFDGRTGNYNRAGISKKKIITAYREKCLLVAKLLNEYGKSSPAELIRRGAPSKTQNILYKNYYRWFNRIDRGLYEISLSGKKAIDDFSAILKEKK